MVRSNSSGAPVSTVLPCNATAVFQTFAAGSAASCQEDSDLGGLQEIADLTDGLCTPVTDLTKLPAILQSVVLPQIVRIQVTVDGGEPFDVGTNVSPSLPAGAGSTVDVDYPIVALGSGEHEICMTVFASDAGGGNRFLPT